MQSRWVLVGGIVAALALLWLVFWPEPSVTNYPSDGETIVAFGDSLVYGYGATDGNDFVSVVERSVGEPIINLGVNGDTTRDGLVRLDDALAKNPKVVILLLGGNDALQKIPEAETFANLATMIERIHASGSMVLLLGVRGGLLTDSFAHEYRMLAAEYHTAFVPDVLDGVFGRPALMADPIHPNDAGYAIIAERVAKELVPLLE